MERVTSVKPQNQSANHIWYITVTYDLVLFLLLKSSSIFMEIKNLPKLQKNDHSYFILFYFPVVLKLELWRKHCIFSFWIYSTFFIYFIKDSPTAYEFIWCTVVFYRSIFIFFANLFTTLFYWTILFWFEYELYEWL